MTTLTQDFQSQLMIRMKRQAATWRNLLILTAITQGSVWADSRTRLYDFEEGTAATEAVSVADKIDLLVVPNAFDCCYQFDSQIAGSNLGIPEGEPIQTWINANVDPTPSLDAVFGAGSGPAFIDVSNGTALDSPANSGNSTRAVDFDGTQALQAVGFRDSYALTEAYDSDAAAVNGDNILSTFFALSQAWVYPDSASSGTSQVVWGVGRENGGVRITSDGFWEMTALGPPGDITSFFPVQFDQWTHIAVSRGGGSATLFVNGAVAATAPPPGGLGFFGAFGDFVTLGADETLAETFDGKVDDFSVAGNSDGGFSAFDDLTYFADIGIVNAPTGVPGDVDQDGDADMDDYLIWSDNSGFDNTFGVGDITTLLKGDLDQNGQIDFFDFQEIANAAAAAGAPLQFSSPTVPEPTSLILLATGIVAVVGRRRSPRRVHYARDLIEVEHSAVEPTSPSGSAYSAVKSLALLVSFSVGMSCLTPVQAEIVVGEDFFYDQLTITTTSFTGGNRFNLQSYGGGQNGPAGYWDQRWEGYGAGLIVGDDAIADPFNSHPFTARVTGENGAQNDVRREYEFADSVDEEQTLYFSARFLATPQTESEPMLAWLGIFSPAGAAGDLGETLVSVGIQDGTFFGNVNGTTLMGDPNSTAADNTDDAAYHTVVGKLEFNVAINLAADYDGSGLIDGGDFLLWQRNFGIDDGSATFSQGDGTGDGNVDGADLEFWNANYGTLTDRLTVFIDPTGVETSNGSTLVVEADFGSGISDSAVNPRVVVSGGVDPNGLGRNHFVDEVVVGTTWADATTALSVPRLTAEVNTANGSVSLVNNTSVDIDLAFYEIESASGSLDTSGWNSLDDQNVDGGEWLENSPTAELLTESNFPDSTTIAAGGGVLSLGNAFDTAGTQDLVVRWGTKQGGEGLLNLANVVVVSSAAVAVPEPASILAASGLLLLCGISQRRLI